MRCRYPRKEVPVDPFFALLIAVAAVILLYLASARNPLTKCPRCSGKGVLSSGLLPWRYRPCPRCGRRGEIRGRFGSN